MGIQHSLQFSDGGVEMTIKIWWIIGVNLATTSGDLTNYTNPAMKKKESIKGAIEIRRRRDWKEFEMEIVAKGDMVFDLYIHIYTYVFIYPAIYKWVNAYTSLYALGCRFTYCFMLYLLVWDITKCNECPPWTFVERVWRVFGNGWWIRSCRIHPTVGNVWDVNRWEFVFAPWPFEDGTAERRQHSTVHVHDS